MKQQIKEKWIKALRSGNYKQTRNKLMARNGAMCCLGVLCDIAIKDGIPIDRDWDNSNGMYLFDEQGESLPESIQDWAGLKSDDPMLGESRASHLNDEKKLNFWQIADEIEKASSI